MNEHTDIDYTEPALLPDDHVAARERVNWHMAMVRRWEADLAATAEPFQKEIVRLQAELNKIVRKARVQIDWHSKPIEDFHRALVRDDNDAARTIRMPHGVTKMTVPKKQIIEFTDKAAALAWVQANHPDHLKIDVNITAMRSIGTVRSDGVVFDATTGENIPGIEAVLPDPTWSLTPDEGAPL